MKSIFQKCFKQISIIGKKNVNQKVKILSKVAGLSSKVVNFLVILRLLQTHAHIFLGSLRGGASSQEEEPSSFFGLSSLSLYSLLGVIHIGLPSAFILASRSEAADVDACFMVSGSQSESESSSPICRHVFALQQGSWHFHGWRRW